MATLGTTNAMPRSALNYGVVGAVIALLTVFMFLRDGTGAYMIVLFGGGFAVVMLGIAYEKYRLAAD